MLECRLLNPGQKTVRSSILGILMVKQCMYPTALMSTEVKVSSVARQALGVAFGLICVDSV